MPKAPARGFARALDAHAPAVSLAALACVAFGVLWSTQAWAAPVVTEEVRVLDAWTERASFWYEVPVEGGEPLPMGEPGYFTSTSPTFRLRYAWALDETESRVAAHAKLHALVLGPPGKGGPAWTVEAPLGEASLVSDATRSLAIESLVDLPALAALVDERTRDQAAHASAWAIVARVSWTDDAGREGRAEHRLPIDLQSPLYRLPGVADLTFVEPHETRAVDRQSEPAGARGLVTAPHAPSLAALGGVTLVLLARVKEDAA